MARPARLAILVVFLLAVVVPGAASAWTPGMQVTLAEAAGGLAPIDLRRQIERNRSAYRKGVLEPFDGTDSAAHMKNPDGTGELHRVIYREVDGAIDAIRAHRPFSEIVQRLGRVSHWVADLNNPLNTDLSDVQEGRYYADFLRYMESAEPRIPLVFYATEPMVESQSDLERLVARGLGRGRETYPLVGAEYRRIGFASGRTTFDDRSTAFAVASLSFSHGVSDITRVLRYIWLAAGGLDERSWLGGDRLFVFDRSSVRLAP